jgi:hypothetical protein
MTIDDRPRAVDDNRLAMGNPDLIDEFARNGIECIDVTIAKISDQQIAGEYVGIASAALALQLINIVAGLPIPSVRSQPTSGHSNATG